MASLGPFCVYISESQPQRFSMIFDAMAGNSICRRTLRTLNCVKLSIRSLNSAPLSCLVLHRHREPPLFFPCGDTLTLFLSTWRSQWTLIQTPTLSPLSPLSPPKKRSRLPDAHVLVLGHAVRHTVIAPRVTNALVKSYANSLLSWPAVHTLFCATLGSKPIKCTGCFWPQHP